MVWKGDTQNREFFDAEDNRILSFLDRMEAKHGKNSVFYAKSAYYSARLAPSDARFSFGSQFWPVLKPELVPWLLESLHENHIPFLFSHASPFAQLPQNFIEKIEAQEDSCIIKFAPQLAVLQHPATGCFVVSPSRFDP